MSAAVTFGVDLSKYQGTLSLRTLHKQGFDFFAAKCTEGANTPDPNYEKHLAEAKDLGALFNAYHFLHSDSSPFDQAKNLADHILDKSVRVMVDVEPEGSSRPSLATANAFRHALKQHGIQAKFLYDPHFWWSQTGSPSLTGTGWALWQAEYPFSTHDFASVLYNKAGGNNSADWASEGGLVPTIWQFASSAKISGYNGNVDVDAFRGTRDELAALNLFTDFAPKAAPDAPAPAPTPAPAPAPTPTRRHLRPTAVTIGRGFLRHAEKNAARHGHTHRADAIRRGLRIVPKR